jgi:putative DNA primase/helicase
MHRYAVDYEFGEKRQVALRLPQCLFLAGGLRAEPDAVAAAKVKLADLDLRLDRCHQVLEERRQAEQKQPRRNPLENPEQVARTVLDLLDPTATERTNVVPFPSAESVESSAPADESQNSAEHEPPLPEPDPASKSPREYLQTDLGNAAFFVDLTFNQLRYDCSRKSWLIWDEHRWRQDTLGRAAECAQHAARLRTRAAVDMSVGKSANDPATIRREKAVAWALQSESRFRIDNVLSLAKDNHVIAVDTTKGWDDDPWLLGVRNGLVDLRAGVLRPGERNDKITKQAGAKYVPTKQCPRFERFIAEILDNNEELITYVRRAIGYTLTGTVLEDCWFGCYGSGRNGKSTLLKILQHVLSDYGYVASFSLVERGRGESKRDFDIAYLHKMRLVIAAETSEGGVWDEERLKRLTGRDQLHAEFKFGKEFHFTPTHKLWFMFNHQPRSRDHSIGFWRRVRLIPFTKQFAEGSADKNLDATLHAERDGILAWAVRACLEWQREGQQADQQRPARGRQNPR